MTVDREQIRRDAEALDDCLVNEVEVLLRDHCLALLAELERLERRTEILAALAEQGINEAVAAKLRETT